MCAAVAMCLFFVACSAEAQFRECKDSPSDCPTQCACRENKVCFNEDLWREGVEECNTYYRCGDPQIEDDQEGCSECLRKLASAAEESCMDEFDPEKSDL